MEDDFADFMTKLSDNAKVSLQHAGIIAHNQGSVYVGTEHMLLGILAQGSSVGAKILADAGVTLDKAESVLNLTPKSLVIDIGMKGLSEAARLTLKMSWEIAKEFDQDFLGTEHMVYSMLKQKNARATVILRDMDVDVKDVSDRLEDYFGREVSTLHEAIETSRKPQSRRERGILYAFGIDMTEKAREGKLDAVIGRDTQIERMVTILNRRTKNNPVLIGEPGVGKTAIVEGLAQRIVHEDVPEYLLGKRIFQLDLSAMIAGTKFRGEFEERLTKVVAQLEQENDIIVFIDELHLLMGAGAAEGSLDAANMLKPTLARGQIRMIGATTVDEYRKYIEKDAAFERRLQSILVPEPSVNDTLSIMKGLRKYYEKHHNVSISDEIVERTVFLADRYVSERYMPDKAIDVLDEAASLVRVKSGRRPSKVRDYTSQLTELEKKCDEAVADEEYEKAALYKTRISHLSDLVEKAKKEAAKRSLLPLTDNAVAQAVSNISGVPVSKLRQSEISILRNLEKHLGKYIIGQEEAVTRVAQAVRRSRSGVASSKRPIGSFVFMGPTGVGKTELARVLAREVFGSDDALIKIDMSEFREGHSASKLLGAPAGYIGYDDGGNLTDRVRRRPYSVVLFDEIEKAHTDIFNMLLQLLEDGVITDGQGRTVSFRNTIIILTSNLGSDKMVKESSLGFYAKSRNEDKMLDDEHQKNDRAARDALKKFMRPELLNRFDAFVTFRALTRKEIGKIFNNLIKELRERLSRKGIGLRIETSAKRHLIDRGFDDTNGARPLRRTIQEELEHVIADKLLAGEVGPGDMIVARSLNKQIVVSIESSETLHAESDERAVMSTR